MVSMVKQTLKTFGIFLWSSVRQTAADLKRIYRMFVRPVPNEAGVMAFSLSKVLGACLVLFLVIGAYRYGQAGAASTVQFQQPPRRAEHTPWLQSPQDSPFVDNLQSSWSKPDTGNVSFADSLDPNSNETVDLPDGLNYMLGNDTSMTYMDDQRQMFLNRIKHLEMLEETDSGNMADRHLPKPDPEKERYLNGDIERLMTSYGVKQYLYFHGEQKRTAFVPTLYKMLPPAPAYAYVITVAKIPPPKFLPTIGNGHIATVVDSADIFMNGLYNGKVSISHRARIPSMIAFRLSSINPSQDHERTYTMDFGDGVWKETWRGQDYVVQKTMYVHRFYQRIIVCEVDIFRIKSKTENQASLRINMELKGGSSKDITFSEGKCPLANCVYISGKTIDTETPKSKKLDVHIYYNPLINGITIPPPRDNAERHKYFFYAAIGPDGKEVYNAFKEARQAIEMNNLLSQHVAAWRTLWSHSFITVQGNIAMQNAIVSASYYIYCSMPMRNDTVAPFVGLSPTDLGHGTSLDDYRGHVFWDQEVWVMPFLLMFKPYLAKLILASRARVVDAAYENAKRNHFRGTQFPWESAVTGFDVTPDIRRNYSLYNHHVTGDIAIAMQTYAYATKDKTLFHDSRYKKVLNGAATFWDSRLEYDKQKLKYVIKSVMPPDEYVSNVNNSAYTNLVAKIAMQAPYRVFDYLGLPSEAFKSVYDKAELIYQPFDRANFYHPEFETYRIGSVVKQADVILMQYPLGGEMTDIVKRRDLTIYEKVTDRDGPAMTFAMFLINYAALGDYPNAHRMLNRTIKHCKPPFGVWTEERDGGGAVNFITGAGGFLQAIINGYGGIRIKEEYLEISPSLPENVTEFIMNGVRYQGGAFIIIIKNTSLAVQQVRTVEAIVPFKVRLIASKKEKELIPGRKAVFPLVKIALMQVYGIGATIHNVKTEVEPRKPSGRLIVEPPRIKEKKQAPDHRTIWNIQPQFALPVFGGGGHEPGKQRDSGSAPPKPVISVKKTNSLGSVVKAKATIAPTSGGSGEVKVIAMTTPKPAAAKSTAAKPAAAKSTAAKPAAAKPAAAKPAAAKSTASKSTAAKSAAAKPAAAKGPSSKSSSSKSTSKAAAAKSAPKPAATKPPPAKEHTAKSSSAATKAKLAKLQALARFGGKKLR